MYKTREEVEIWLVLMNVKNYVINDDLTVDVNSRVDLSFKDLKDVPIKFNKIEGDFNCSDNNLTSLEGCPTVINGGFHCGFNNLTSLKGCPTVINGGFHCSNNYLTSLECCPKEVNGNFSCNNNNRLISFEFFPQEINGNFIFLHNIEIKEEELVNFHCKMENIEKIYSDFNEDGNVEEFLNKVNYYKSKKENELLKELSVNSNNVKLNKKL